LRATALLSDLPCYAPELNAIERSWRDLKRHHLAHQTFTDAGDLERTIQDSVADMNRERAKALSCDNLRRAAQCISQGALVRATLGQHLAGMHPPIIVRELSGTERAQLEAGRRSRSAFTVRRAQIVRLSAAGRRGRLRPVRAAPAGPCATPSAPSMPAAWRR
jgi:hypothetical protein